MLFEKAERSLSAIEDISVYFSSLIVVLMMLITTADVILRYIFDSPLPGVFVLCELLMVGVVYLGLSYVQRRKGHVRVDIFVDKIKGSPRIVFEIAVLLLSLFAFALVFFFNAVEARESWVTQDYTMGLVEYPIWPSRTVFVLGIFLLCLRFMIDIGKYIVELRARDKRWFAWVMLAALPLSLLCFALVTLSSGLTIAPVAVGAIFLAVMLVLLLGGLPVSFALLVLGVSGYWIIAGPERVAAIIGFALYDKTANYGLSVVPLFILMGHLAYQAGFAKALYDTAQKWIGHIPGGLAQATVLGGAAFGAACGSGIASCATLSKMCVPEMRSAGIDRKLALGTVAGAGTIAQMIPPSVLMVIYAFITDQSVAKLLIAGILPGIVAAANFMIMIYVRCKLNPNLAPQMMKNVSWKDRVASLKGIWGVGVIAVMVMGGIYSGMFTPTEAGGLGACCVLILGVATKGLNGKRVKDSMIETTRTTAMIFLIIGTAQVFGYFLGISRVPAEVTDFIVGLDVPRFVILLVVLLMFLVAGFFIDMLAFAFLTLPVIYPTILALGYDPLWFGVITVHMFEVALITPPFGLNLFILKETVPEARLSDAIKGVTWFVITDIITLAIYIVFPEIATWLPSMMD